MSKKKNKKKSFAKKQLKNKSKSSKRNKIPKNIPTLNLKKESEIAMDFATKIYQRFDKIVKSVILFGSTAKQDQVAGSDIDIIILLDDVSINWDQELVAWYREELEKLIQKNPYQESLHINTVKLSTWWEDLMRGDPVVMNILRYGEAMIDFAGFFNPLKALLIAGKIKSTPEAIYSALQRAPQHIARSKMAELGSIDGLFWSMVDSSHAALIAAKVPPASPEHIPADLKEIFVNSGKLKMKYVVWYRDLLVLHKKIAHGEIKNLKGVEIDEWQNRAEEFLEVMANLVKELVE
ncbi:MAG: nucleotidyltransferase domain-containing protein [Nanoarchaeota archaeon]|nr:nucleotidyltransferase domain-containing protein [Nanoarchaeota archaeon]MBU1501754.1 nucleotidyltransferase domain-containing protein [Nanoarchaeota archaeon]MBU2459281.1 nucleotidyltransferase domain-containing protein [Nanoarchaeota archaeon]